jgi:PAS domain S-box-containing protein
MTEVEKAEIESDERALIVAAVLQSALDCIVAADTDGRIIEFNPAAVRTFGWSRAEAIGQKMDELIVPEFHRAAHRAGMARYLSSGEAHVLGRRIEMEALRRDGTVFPVELSITEARQGERRLFVANLRDLTEQRTAQAALDESRSQLIAFFDNLPTSIYLKRIDHTVIYVSKHLAEQYGKSPEDMVGRHEYDLHVEAMQPYLQMMDQHILTTGEAVLLEGEHLQFNRQELVSRFPVLNDKGEITHIGGMNFDIDARAKAQAELVESRASLQAFFDNLPGLAFLSSLDGTIIAANAYLAEHFGLKKMQPDYLIGKSGADLLPAAWTRDAEQAVRTNRDEGKPFSFETTIDSPDGKRHVSASRFPIRNALGDITHVGGLVFDRTQEMVAATEIAASRESLHRSEKLAALGSMLAGVSHELNNPLAAVIGQTALLAEDLDGTPHAERVSKIRRAADRCARIVQSFLAMARQKAPEYRSVSINDQVRSAVELTEYQMRTAQVALDLRLADDLPRIEADPDELHQVIANLLTNARQALEEVSGERRISVTTARRGGMIRLEVADTGRGIDPAARDRIFDPFFTTKAVGAGTGIGLSYSLGIIEAHGGTIEIEPSAVGTVFVVRLPVKDGLAETATPEAAQAEPAKGRALVIDDETDVAETLADMLGRQGLDVSIALGGLAGQAAMLGGAPFDLIFSDIRMPDLDGPALYAWIAANRPDLIGKVAFVTGDTMSGRAAEFLTQAGCPVLEKPFTPAALRLLVTALTEAPDGEAP